MPQFYVYETFSCRVTYRKTVEAATVEDALTMARSWGEIAEPELGPMFGDACEPPDIEYDAEPVPEPHEARITPAG